MVTADQVRDAVKAAGITWVDHHACSICGHMVGYSIAGEQLFFCAGCNCTPWPSPPEPRAWAEVADSINIQPRAGDHGDVAAKFAKRFGIELAAAT